LGRVDLGAEFVVGLSCLGAELSLGPSRLGGDLTGAELVWCRVDRLALVHDYRNPCRLGWDVPAILTPVFLTLVVPTSTSTCPRSASLLS